MPFGLDAVALAAALLLSRSPLWKAEAELPVEIRADELKAHVYRLASREFLGRKGPGAARASQHLAAAFERLGLRPAFGDSYFQPIPWLVGRKGSFAGRNVGAGWPGRDPQPPPQRVLLRSPYHHPAPPPDP